jgi:hypothetical protein
MIGGKRQWIRKLKEVTEAYNSTVHNTIGMRPIDVNRKNAPLLFDYMEQKRKQVIRKRKNKFDLGDFVRIPLNFKMQKNFVKDGTPSWTSELFQIFRIEFGTHRPTYFICDLEGTLLAQRFYENELNFVASFAELD